MKTRSRTGYHKKQTGCGGHPGVSGSPTGSPLRYPNGDVACREWNDRIDMSVCITRSTRHPEKCRGCPLNH